METCRVCGSPKLSAAISLKEMMFGSGERFDYFRCLNCGCLQIGEMPADMATHYPADYYSLETNQPTLSHRFRDWLTLTWPRWICGRFRWFNRGNLRSVAKLDRSARILDVGCGSGELIEVMARNGFKNVSGIDPFAEPTKLVRRGELSDLDGPYDVVMLHHSFEHIWDQHGTLADIRRILVPGGKVIIRIPTIESWQAKQFGEHWAHLDPPRHFYLHSRKSISIALEKAGFDVDRIAVDSNDFGVTGSWKARMGRPTIDPQPIDSPAYRHDLAEIERRKPDDGDMIAVYGSTSRGTGVPATVTV